MKNNILEFKPKVREAIAEASDIEARIHRIRMSLDKIHKLMDQLKEVPDDTEDRSR